MGTPLKNPPVYFTVAQVRFNALLKLSEFLPTIQENLRRAGFPDFTTRKTIALQIVVQDGKPAPSPLQVERFVFGTVDQAHSFVLTQDALTLQSTRYGRFEDFSAMFLRGLTIVHDVVQLDFTERVGLRYLDHVAPKAGDTLDAYLAPEVLGLSARLGGKSLHSFSETFNHIGVVQLRSRVVIQEGGLSFPPDLLPEGMVLDKRFMEFSGHHALLDTDGFVEGRAAFSLDVVGQKLNDIHEVIGAAFTATTTKHARQVWDEQ